MVELAINIWRDFENPDQPASGPWNPRKSDIREWGTMLEQGITAGQAGSVVFPDKATMDGQLAYDQYTMGWVINDATAANNGIFRKVGASGTGSWAREGDLPYNVIPTSNAGAGNPNGVIVEAPVALSAEPYKQLVSVKFVAANTGPMTLNIANSGLGPRSLFTNTGEVMPAGYIKAGMTALVMLDSGLNYRLFAYGDSNAISVIYAMSVGGTADDVAATTRFPVSTTAYAQLVAIPFNEENTGPMTLSLNGSMARPLVTNVGGAIPAGYIKAGMAALVMRDGFDNYRLFSYGDAEAVQQGAEETLAEFQRQYLGQHATHPTTDNEGAPLQEGAFYWNTTSKAHFYWDGDSWEAFPYATVVDGGVTPAKLDPSLHRYVGFYNGGDSTSYWDIGLMKGRSPKAFGRAGIPSPRTQNGDGQLDNEIKGCPTPVLVGDEIYLYYEGNNGVGTQIFMEIYDTEGGLRDRGTTPIITTLDVPGSDTVMRPSVIYEPDDVSAPFKMAFSRASSGAGTLPDSVWVATSLNGFQWTILGQAFGLGTGFESVGLVTTGRLVKEGGTYHIFYSGFDGSFWKGAEASNSTFTDTGWTKNPNNPLLLPRGGYDIPLTADTVINDRTVKVANSSIFDVGAPIMIWTNDGEIIGPQELNIIEEIPDSTTLIMRYKWIGAYTMSYDASVSQIHAGSVDFSEVWYENGVWKTIFTAFQFRPGAIRESNGYAETADLNAGFTIDPTVWPLPLLVRQEIWDKYSAENLKFVRVQ